MDALASERQFPVGTVREAESALCQKKLKLELEKVVKTSPG